MTIEASGIWWWLVDLLGQLGHQPVISDPTQTRAIAAGPSTRVYDQDGARTDCICWLWNAKRLSGWFVKLRIWPEFIEPDKPCQNGRHENVHGALKRHMAPSPSGASPSSNAGFDAFRREFNTVRPREALGGAVPAEHYRPLPCLLPRHLGPLIYPGRFEVRYVSRNGGIRWNNR